MEINEIVSYFLNVETNILEISFRTSDDSDDVIRTDSIDFSLTEEFGFELITEGLNFYDVEDDEDFIEDSDSTQDIELDEDELLSFLNGYYTVHPDYLPESQFF